MLRAALLILTVGLVAELPVWADGVPPRTAASDYPAFQRTQDFMIGATLLSADQVKKILPAEMAKRYIVVEVAFYPRDGATVEVFGFDFSLRFGKELEAHPVTPEETLPGRISHGRGPQIPGQVHVDTDTAVVLSTGTDPVTGRRGTHVGTYENVGVGVGADNRRQPPPPPSTSNKTDRNEAEVRGRALPDGKTTVPVAGYLYFPKRGSTNGPGELKYLRNSTQVILQLPVPK